MQAGQVVREFSDVVEIQAQPVPSFVFMPLQGVEPTKGSQAYIDIAPSNISHHQLDTKYLHRGPTTKHKLRQQAATYSLQRPQNGSCFENPPT